MFSQLGPLFKTHLRQAEKSDARLEIRRDERNDQGRKHDEPPQEEESSALWEDSTTVSIEALKVFLSGFLTSKTGTAPETSNRSLSQAETESLPQEPLHPVNTRTARAVKAYGSAAAQASPPPAPPQMPENNSDRNDLDLSELLEADELRTIHVLVTELDNLARNGVQTLTIEKADSFLKALVFAVQAEKLKDQRS